MRAYCWESSSLNLKVIWDGDRILGEEDCKLGAMRRLTGRLGNASTGRKEKAL